MGRLSALHALVLVREKQWSSVDFPLKGVVCSFDFPFADNVKSCWTNSPVVGDVRRHDTHVTSLWWDFLNSSQEADPDEPLGAKLFHECLKDGIILCR